jgi:hypothetical protein
MFPGHQRGLLLLSSVQFLGKLFRLTPVGLALIHDIDKLLAVVLGLLQYIVLVQICKIREYIESNMK